MNKEQLKAALAQVASSAGAVPGMQSAFAELLIKVVEPTHLSLDIFSAFMPVTQMKPGDTVMRRVRKGKYPVRTMVPGSKHLIDATVYQDQMNWVFDRLIAGTGASVWEVRNGDVDTVERMRTDLRADIFDEIVSRVFTLLTSAWDSTQTPNNWVDASSAGVTATILDAMIENVLDYAGSVKAIVGSRKALLPVYKFAAYKEYVLGGTGTDRAAFPTGALDEFFRTNKVSAYNGIPLVELKQVFAQRLPDLRARTIPTDKVLVVGDNAGEVALMGGTEFQEHTDTSYQPPMFQVHAYQGYGLIVDNVQALGVVYVGDKG